MFKGLIILIIAVFVLIFLLPDDQDKKMNTKHDANIDSLITAIKNDEIWAVKDVQFADSILKIAVKPEKDAPINAYYFDNTYKLVDYDNVLEVELYKNKIVGSPESTIGELTARIIDDFNARFVSSYDGNCKPLTEYIKASMHDAGSYENVNTKVNYTTSGNFEVYQQFRGKNAFGALVLNEVHAVIDRDGNIISAK